MPPSTPPRCPDRPQLPKIPINIYLYLREKSWVKAWTEGGEVPISPASKYRSTERIGTYTPDEVLVRQINGFTPDAERLLYQEFGNDPFDVHFDGCSFVVGEDVTPLDGWIMSKEEDVLILCLSSFLSNHTSNKLEKSAVVRINNIYQLENILSKQIGSQGIINRVYYTNGSRRGHFLKSNKDAWMHEVRIVWQPAEIKEITVTLPPGMAEEIDLSAASDAEFDATSAIECDWDQFHAAELQFREEAIAYNRWHLQNDLVMNSGGASLDSNLKPPSPASTPSGANRVQRRRAAAIDRRNSK